MGTTTYLCPCMIGVDSTHGNNAFSSTDESGGNSAEELRDIYSEQMNVQLQYGYGTMRRPLKILMQRGAVPEQMQ